LIHVERFKDRKLKKASNEKSAGAIQFNGWSNQSRYETDGLFFSSRTADTSYIWDMVLTEQGQVGIGTHIPTEKLQVNGNVKATAFKTGDIFFHKNHYYF
jgi:hypothetical protein